MRIEMKDDGKSITSPNEEEGVARLREKLKGKKGTSLKRALASCDSWPWGKANFPEWREIIDQFDDHLNDAVTGALKDDKFVLRILQFTELLISNSTDPGMYNSHDRLLGLLSYKNPEVVLSVLALFDSMFKHTPLRGNSLLDHNDYKQKIFSLATGFCVPHSAKSLRHISLRASAQEEEAMRKQLRFAFPRDGDVKEGIIDLSQFGPNSEIDVAELASKERVPSRFHFSLKHHVRFARNFSSLKTRQIYVRIKLTAIRLAMCFSWSKKEFLHKHFKSNPHLTEMLLDLLQHAHQVPLEIAIISLHSLKSITQVPYVEMRIRDLGVLTDGIIPSLLHQCITKLKSKPDEASTLLLAEAILSFIQKIGSENIIYAFPRAFRPPDVMDWMVNLISNHSITCAIVLLRALRIIEKLISPNRIGGLGTSTSASRTRFHQANGFDVCLTRIQELYINPPEKRKTLTFVRPGKMDVAPANHLLGKCVRSLLRVMSTSVRHHRRPVRSTAIKDGVFTSVITSLWKLSQADGRGDSKEHLESSKAAEKAKRTSKRRKVQHAASKNEAKVPAKMDVESVKTQSAAKILGDKIFAHSCALLCNVIQNRPSCLKSLHEGGITMAFLESLRPEMLHTEVVIKTTPETIRCLCLNSEGLKIILERNPLSLIFNLISSSKRSDIDVLTPQTIYFLGRSFEELFRHHPAFVPPGIKCCKEMLANVARDFDISNKTKMKDQIRCLMNVSQLLDTLLRQFGKKFVEQGEMDMISKAVKALYTKQIEMGSMTDVCFDLVPPMVTIANHDPEKVTKHLLKDCSDLLDTILESESFKQQTFFTWREEKDIAPEVQQVAHVSWYMSVLLKLHRRSHQEMIKHSLFKTFVEKVSRVVCMCKWTVTCALLENTEMAAETKKRKLGDNKDTKQKEILPGNDGGDEKVEAKIPSSDETSSSGRVSASKKVFQKEDRKTIDSFLSYRFCSKHLFLLAGKLMRLLSHTAMSSGGEFADLVDQVMMLYLDFKPTKLKDWSAMLSFAKGTIKLCAILLLNDCSYKINNSVFNVFCRRGGTAKIVKILKWLLNIPPRSGQDSARIAYFQKSPWGITDKCPVTSKTISVAQSLLVEIGKFIRTLSTRVPKSSVCLELIQSGLNERSALYGAEFCTSVVNTAHRLLTNRTDESKKKQHNEEDLKKLVNMGFGRARSLRALRMHRYRLVRAMEWLLAHPDDPLSNVEMEVDDVDFQKSLVRLDSEEFIHNLLSCLRALSKMNTPISAADDMVFSTANLLTAMCGLDDKAETKESDSVNDKKETEKSATEKAETTKMVAEKTEAEKKQKRKESVGKWRRSKIMKEILGIMKSTDPLPLKSPKIRKSKTKASSKNRSTKLSTNAPTGVNDLYIFVYLLAIILDKDAKCRAFAVKNNIFPVLMARAKRLAESLKSNEKATDPPEKPKDSEKAVNLHTTNRKRKGAPIEEPKKKVAKGKDSKSAASKSFSSKQNGKMQSNKATETPQPDMTEACLCAMLCTFGSLLGSSSRNIWNERALVKFPAAHKPDSDPQSNKSEKGSTGRGKSKALAEIASPLLTNADVDSLLAFCVSLLHLPVTGALPPLLELLSKLTKSHRNAVYFVKRGGLSSLLNIRSMPSYESSLVSICQSILRHITEHPVALQHNMEKDIFFSIIDGSQQATKKVTLQETISHLVVVARRDPSVFLKSLKSICTFEKRESTVFVKLKSDKMKKRFKLGENDAKFTGRFISTLLHSLMIKLETPKAVTDEAVHKATTSSSGAITNKDEKKSESVTPKPAETSERGLGYKPLLSKESIMRFLRKTMENNEQVADVIASFRPQPKGRRGKQEAKEAKDFITFCVERLVAKSGDTLYPPGMLLVKLCKNQRKSAPHVIETVIRHIEKIAKTSKNPNKPSPNVLSLLIIIKVLLLQSQPQKREFVRYLLKSKSLEVFALLLHWMQNQPEQDASTARTLYKVLVGIIREDEKKPIELDEKDMKDEKAEDEKMEWIDASNRGSSESIHQPSNPFAQVFGSSRDLLDVIRRRTQGGRRRGGVQVVFHNPLGQYADGGGLIRFNLFQQHDDHDQEGEENLDDEEFGHDDHVLLVDDDLDNQQDEEEEDEMLIEQADLFGDDGEDDDIGDEDDPDPEDQDDLSEVRMEDDEDVQSEEVEIEGHVFQDDEIGHIAPGLNAIEIGEVGVPEEGGPDDVDEEDARRILEAEEESKMDSENVEDDENGDEVEDEEEGDLDEDDMDDVDQVIRGTDPSAVDDFLPSTDIQPIRYDIPESLAATRMPQYFSRLFEQKYDRHESREVNMLSQRWYEFGESKGNSHQEARALQQMMEANIEAEITQNDKAKKVEGDTQMPRGKTEKPGSTSANKKESEVLKVRKESEEKKDDEAKEPENNESDVKAADVREAQASNAKKEMDENKSEHKTEEKSTEASAQIMAGEAEAQTENAQSSSKDASNVHSEVEKPSSSNDRSDSNTDATISQETKMADDTKSTEEKATSSNSAGASNQGSSGMEVDPAFLAALPPEIQAEILSTQSMQIESHRRAEERVRSATESKEQSSSRASESKSSDSKQNVGQDEKVHVPDPSQSSSSTGGAADAGNSGGGPDPDFLEALPPELRAEVLAQHQAMQRRQNTLSSIDHSRAQEMDQASVLATFDPRLRREWLIHQDESVLATLPSSILAEAVMLRHRASRPYIFARRGANRASLAAHLRAAYSDSGIIRGEESEAKETPKVDPVLWIGREGKPAVPKELVLALVARLCMFRFIEISNYNKVMSAICAYNVNRHLLLHAFMIMLNFKALKSQSWSSEPVTISDEEYVKMDSKGYWQFILSFVRGLPTRMIGDDSVTFGSSLEFPAPLLVARILQVMTNLVTDSATYRPHMMLHFFFKDSTKDIRLLFPSTNEASKKTSWLEQLFALYSSAPFMWSAKHVEILTQFLAELLAMREEKKKEGKALLSKQKSGQRKADNKTSDSTAEKPDHKLTVESETAAKGPAGMDTEQGKTETAAEVADEGKKEDKMDVESGSTLMKGAGEDKSAKEDVWKTSLIPMDMPSMNPVFLKAFIRAFQKDNCAEKVFNMAMKIARYLAEVKSNRDELLKEIGQTTMDTTREIDSDLKNCIASMPSSKKALDIPMMKFGGSLYKLSGRQARLLRLLSFLDSMGVLKESSKSKEEKGSKLEIASTDIDRIVPSLDILWNTLDRYLLKLVPPKSTESKTAPQRGGGTNNNNKKGTKRALDGTKMVSPLKRQDSRLKAKSPKSPKLGRTRSSRRLRRTSSVGTELKASSSSSKGEAQDAAKAGVDLEEDDSDVSQLLQLLPLIESYFIVKAPKSVGDIEREEFRDFCEFTHTHSRILNIFCQKKPSLMQRTLKSLLWHPKKILNFNNKHTHFLHEIQKQRAATGNIGSFRIMVRRKRLFEDSYHQLKQLSDDELKSPLSVKFHGEAGVDAGGLTREWFLLLSRAIFDPNYCLFVAAANNNNVFQPSKSSHWNPEHLLFFKFVGRFVGKAIYDGQLLDAYFTRSFYKHMLGVKPTISDVESIDPDYYKSLRWMLENPIENVLDLEFTREGEEFGVKRVTELKENGKNIKVTDENKVEYVSLMAERMLTDDIRKQIDAFLEGFREMIDTRLLSIFNEQELELLICGLPDIDYNDLKANTEYKGFNPSSEVISWFWQIVEDMTQEEKALLVQFVTGTSKVPIQGFKQLQGMNGIQRFQIHKGQGEDRLPTAHTCFNQLDLPSYTSLKSMRKNLLLAIREGSEGFSFR